MKSLVLIILFLASFKSFAQVNVYTYNNGKYYDEKTVKENFDKVKKAIPAAYYAKAIIFHKINKKDTVVNYVEIGMYKKESPADKSTEELEFKQNPAFLLLGKKLPEFKLKDLDGKVVSSNSLLGKPTFINFWAFYCGPCIAEMPQLSKLKNKYNEKMNFISITENSEANDHVRDFLKDKNFNFLVLESGEFYKTALNIGAIPKNLFVDEEGIVQYIQPNYPLDDKSNPVDLNDPNNYFTAIINGMIKNTSFKK